MNHYRHNLAVPDRPLNQTSPSIFHFLFLITLDRFVSFLSLHLLVDCRSHARVLRYDGCRLVRFFHMINSAFRASFSLVVVQRQQIRLITWFIVIRADNRLTSLIEKFRLHEVGVVNLITGNNGFELSEAHHELYYVKLPAHFSFAALQNPLRPILL